MRIIKVAAILSIFVCIAASSAHSQMGNLNWVKGKEKKQSKDIENAPLLISLDLCAGDLRTTDKWGDYDVHTDDAVSSSLALGINYRFVRISSGESMILDFGVHGSLGVLTTDGVEDIGFIGSVGPEIGVRLFANSGTIFKPFFSFGPGLLIGDDYPFDDFTLIWVPRMGVEIHRKGAPWAFAIGAKYHSRETTHEERFIYGHPSSSTISEDNYMGFLSFGVRI